MKIGFQGQNPNFTELLQFWNKSETHSDNSFKKLSPGYFFFHILVSEL